MKDRPQHIIIRTNRMQCMICKEQKELPMGGIKLKKGIEMINEFISHHKQCAK